MSTARSVSAALLLGAVVLAGAGCGAAAIAPAYTQDDLKVRCERQRGMWHPDSLTGGFCEYRAAYRSE